MGTSFSAAERLVRTENTRIAAQADKLSYEDSGIKKYRFIATLDDVTSVICQSLDNQVFRTEDMQEGVNSPPMHVNCRSTTTADFGVDALNGLERRARDAEGNTIKVPANMKFRDYKKKFLV